MKRIAALVMTGLVLVAELQTQALDVGTIVGPAKSFYNGVIGQTTVTPACAMGYWRLNSSGTYASSTYNNNWTISRNVTTGAYFYTFTYTSTPGSSGSSTDPFDVVSLPSRRNYHCDLSYTDPDTGVTTPYIYDLFETFYSHVWCASVSHTGYFSPQPPYSVWLKSYDTTLPSGCAAITPEQTAPPVEILELQQADESIRRVFQERFSNHHGLNGEAVVIQLSTLTLTNSGPELWIRCDESVSPYPDAPLSTYKVDARVN